MAAALKEYGVKRGTNPPYQRRSTVASATHSGGMQGGGVAQDTDWQILTPGAT